MNLNRKRPSRKRYGFSSEFLQSGALEQSSQFDSLSTSGVYSSGETVPLQQLGGGDPIYRDISEKESLSKWKNGLNRLLPQPIKNALLPPRGRKGWLRFLFVHLPVLQWLWTYRPKQLIGDIIAGITIGVTHIPQGTSRVGVARCRSIFIYGAPVNTGRWYLPTAAMHKAPRMKQCVV